MPLIFVYGTLKRGCKNHRQLDGQRFVGEARTGPGWVMYHLGAYPGMVSADGEANGVAGELWEVTAEALARLDQFEGVPEGLYRRGRIALAEPPGCTADTYIFLHDISGHRRLPENWSE